MTARLSPRCVALLALTLVSAASGDPLGRGQGTVSPQPGDPGYVQQTPIYPSGTPYYVPPASVPDAEIPDPHYSVPFGGYTAPPVVPSSPQFYPQPYTPGYDPDVGAPPPVIYGNPVPQAGYYYPPQATEGPARIETPGLTTGTYYGPQPQTLLPSSYPMPEPSRDWSAPSDDIQDVVPGQQPFQAPYEPPVAPTNFLPEPPSESGFVTDGESRGRD